MIKSKVIGITGGIASGKTVATSALAAAGYLVVDADEVSRALTAKGTAAEKTLLQAFPAAEKNGALDRKALREIISNDKAERERLNAITHPLILDEIKRRISAAASPVVLSAPLLFETGLDALCEKTVCITCPYDTRVARLIERDGCDERAAARMIATQLQDDERIRRSDYVISSDRPIDEFKTTIVELINSIMLR